MLVYGWVAAVKVSALNSFGLNSRGLALAGDPNSTTQSTVSKSPLSQLLRESLSGIVDLMTFPQVLITFRSREYHPWIYWWGSEVKSHAQGHTANEHDSHGSSTCYYKHSPLPTEVDMVNSAKTLYGSREDPVLSPNEARFLICKKWDLAVMSPAFSRAPLGTNQSVDF